MKLKYKMTSMEINGEIMAIPVESNTGFNGLIRMNKTTECILKALENDVTEDEIVDILFDKFDADKDVIRESVRNVIEVLTKNKLCE